MRRAVTAIVTAALLGATALAQTAERLTDPQVTQLVENIDRAFDRWKDDLERRNMDDAVIKSAAGTVDVRKFLKDMEDDIDLVKDRLKSNYAAGPEVTALLRRASDVERRTAEPGGGEAWKTLRTHLSALAATYGLGWPVDTSANARHKMDGELAADAKLLADASDRLRSGALDAAKAAKRPQSERDQADRDMKALKEAAKQLEANLKDHRAVSADATRVLELSRQAAAFARGAGPLKPEATNALTSVEKAAAAIAQAFGKS